MSQNHHQQRPERSIVLTGGGTGGHITPILSVARALKTKDSDCRLVYIGLKGGELENRLGKELQVFDEIRSVTSGKFRRYYGQNWLDKIKDLPTLLSNIRDFFKVIFGIIQAWNLLRKLKPDLVFSKGGYVVVPVGIAAKLRKIPIVTHDSDAIAGLANNIIGRWAVLQTNGLPAKSNPHEDPNFIGVPLDERIKPVSSRLQADYKSQLGIPEKSRMLLFMGGGMGSKSLNQRALSMAGDLLNEYPDLYIYIITGPAHLESVNQSVEGITDKELTKRLKTLDFTDELYMYSGAADLIVCRAGATTIAELALEGKAAVIVPAPFLASGHQLKNVEWLEDNQAAVVVSDDSSAQDIKRSIEYLLGDERRRSELSRNIKRLAKPAAAEDLAGILLEEASKSANGGK